MAYDGSGGFDLYSPGNPVVTGTTISSTWANNTLNDIANNGLSYAITKDGQTTVTGNIPFAGFYATNVGIRAISGSVGTPGLSFNSETDCGFYVIGTNNVGMSLAGAKTLDFATTGVTGGALSTAGVARWKAAETVTVHARYGFLDESTVEYAAAGSNSRASFDASATIQGSENSDHHHGFQDATLWNGSGTISNLVSFQSGMRVTGAGTVTSASGLTIVNPTGAGPITTLHGIFIDNLTRGGTNYAIQTVGSAQVDFGGALTTGGRITSSAAFAGAPSAAFVNTTNNSYSYIQMVGAGASGGGQMGFFRDATAVGGMYGDATGLTIHNNTSDVEAFFPTAGGVKFPRVGTTASAANAFLDNADSNRLLRSTSSVRYKTDIKDVTADEVAAVMKLRPITYLSNAEADDKDRRWFGFTAEDAEEKQPMLVTYSKDEDGKTRPDGFQYERMCVALLAKVQELETRLAALE